MGPAASEEYEDPDPLVPDAKEGDEFHLKSIKEDDKFLVIDGSGGKLDAKGTSFRIERASNTVCQLQVGDQLVRVDKSGSVALGPQDGDIEEVGSHKFVWINDSDADSDEEN